ncbi:MAG: tetratricopeptide repeat protein [bacterium]|nr:tetratricopeptide repeat protein [bacterium]
MQNKEATALFMRSKKLYAEKRYVEALQVLDELDAEFPNTKNIMLPRARCLAKLKRTADAQHLCRQLIAIYADPKAEELLAHLGGADAADAGSGLDTAKLFGVQAQPPAVPPVPVEEEEESSGSTLPYYIGGGVVLGIVMIGVALAFLKPQDGTAPGASATASGPAPAETAAAPAELAWYRSYADAMYLDEAESLPPRLLFVTDNSDECYAMQEEVFGEPSIRSLLSGFVCARINPEEDEDFRYDFETDTFPTVILIDNLGREVRRHEGVIDARQLYDTLTQLDLKPLEPLEFSTGAIVLLIVLGILIEPWPLFLTLMFMDKLPGNGFLIDLGVTALIALGVSAIAAIPCIGWILAIMVLRAVYEFGLLDFVVLVGLNAAVGALYVLMAVAILGPEVMDFLAAFA